MSDDVWADARRDKHVHDMEAADLADELIGKTVVAVDDETITLDDGTTLIFEAAGECCAWFEYNLKSGYLTDNAITSVEYGDNDDLLLPGAADVGWTIHILAGDARIAELNIWGDGTSGYYCRSISLTVRKPESGNRGMTTGILD